MFIAMNRFKIKPGKESDFIEIWKNRETFLDEVPGFKDFNLMQGATDDECTLFVSHSVWDSETAFREWTKSEAFRKAHANAKPATDIYLGPPKFEGFSSVL